MLNKIVRYGVIHFLLLLAAFAQKSQAQSPISGPTCVVTGQNYTYNYNNSYTGSPTFTWGISTGTIQQSQGASVIVQWTATGTGSITLSVNGVSQTPLNNISVVAPLSGGSITANATQTIAYNTVPAAISCAVATNGYCSPAYTYLWQYSTDGTTWNSAGQTTQNLTVSTALTVTTYYRRQVTETHTNAVAYSGIATVFVNPPFSSTTISPAAQNIFTGATPSAISGPAATGGSCGGAYTYLWQQSTDGGTTWANATGTNNATSYTPPALTVTTSYRRKDICGTDVSYSNTATVTVFQHVTAGTITPSSLTITYATDPGAIAITAPTGGMCAPTYSYTWQRSIDNSTWTDVATAQNYDPGTLPTSPASSVYYFRRKVVCSSETVYSNIITITVNPQVFPGTIYPSTIGIQTGTNPGTLYANPATGGNCSGSFSYQWYSSTDGISFTPITGATGVSYVPGSLTATTYYERQVTCGTDQLVTNIVTVNVNTGTVYYNYIQTRTITKAGITDEASAAALTNITDVKEATQYFDGLGRPIQAVSRQATPAGYDMVAINAYDQFGREVLKYLPYVSAGNDGNYRTNALAEQYTFNSTQFAGEQNFYSRSDFEASPLNLVQATYAPGNSWAGSNRGVQAKYWANTATDAVRIWTVTDVANSFGTYATSATYAAGALLKHVTIDENGNQVIEFKDMQGRVILKKVQNTGTADAGTGSGYTGWLSTYYIYDDYNQLRCVVQPAGVALLTANSWNMSALSGVILSEQCFRYEYDGRNRMTMKQVPGAGAVDMVYDQRDRLVFTQDAKMAPNNQWLGTLYDAQNRPIETYMMTYTGGFTALQSYVSANTGIYANAAQTANGSTVPTIQTNLYVTTRQPGQPFYKAQQTITLDGSFTSEAGAEFYTEIDPGDGAAFTNGYTVSDNPVPPGATVIALIITNYDTYTATAKTYSTTNNSKLDRGTNTYNDALPATASTLTRGMVTSTKVRVIENAADLTQGNWLETASFYDNKGRAVQVQADNYKGGHDAVTSLYSFTAQVLCTYEVHNNASAGIVNVPVKTNMNYDAMGRMLNVKKNINDDNNAALATTTQRTIASYTYNELGQLTDKKIGQKTVTGSAPQSTPLEDQVYDYNIRGWLLGINKNFVKDAATNYFGFELGYDKAAAVIAGTSYTTPAYNGNISGTTWKNAGDGEKRKYDFTYDAVNRLTGADFNQYTSGGFNKTAGIDYSVNNLTYDGNGNIKSMQQNGWKVGGSVTIDNLLYTYIPNTNRLQNVIDNNNDVTTTLGDFRSSSTYMGVLGSKTTANPTIYTDYTYDANGNLGIDKNKDITGITYNYLNLPYTITVSGKGTITYIYDATGSKLEKRTVETAPPAGVSGITTTTYLGAWVYQNNVLQYFGMEEGRVRVVPVKTYNNSQVYAYDYMLKDHLGNTRAVLTDELQQDIYPAATLEANTAALNTEKAYYDIQDANIVDESTVTNFTSSPGSTYYNNNGNPPANNNPNANTTAASTKLYKLNGSAGVKMGLGVTLKVMTGDVVDVYAKSFWHSTGTDPSNTYPITAAINNFIGAFAATSAVTNAGKGATATALETGGSPTPGTATSWLNGVPNPTATVPKAYINWVLFDEQFTVVGSGSGFDLVSATSDNVKTHHNTISISKGGYLYVYCSNESNYDVFFDNLQVIQTRGPLTETDNYYPFGLLQSGISARAAGKQENKMLYNGKELQHKEFSDGSGLEWEDYGARMYDGQIGRWVVPDLKSEKYLALTNYNYCNNNPVKNIDADGKSFVDAKNTAMTYTTDDKGNMVWSSNTTADVKRIASAMMLTETGKKQFTQMYKSDIKIHASISSKVVKREYTNDKGEPEGVRYDYAQTHSGNDDPKDSYGQFFYKENGVIKGGIKEATVTVLLGSIKEARAAGVGQYVNLTEDEAIGLAMVHESVHSTDPEQINGEQSAKYFNKPFDTEAKPDEIENQAHEELKKKKHEQP